MDIGYITDIGKKREKNEDSFFVDKENLIFVVADGVGGQNAGEIASKIAVEEISRYLKKNIDILENNREKIFAEISKGLLMANKKILEYAELDASYAKMATTAVVMVIRGKTAYISNIGDSRAYLIREQIIKRITEDHTVANQLIQQGKLTEQELLNLADNKLPINVFSTITRALGTKKTVLPDDYTVEIEENDIFLICSDGLYGEVSEETIIKIIKDSEDSQSASNRLIEEANRNGGRDNITSIIIKIGVKNHE